MTPFSFNVASCSAKFDLPHLLVGANPILPGCEKVQPWAVNAMPRALLAAVS